MFSSVRLSTHQELNACGTSVWRRDRRISILDRVRPADASSFRTQCWSSYGCAMPWRPKAIRLGEPCSPPETQAACPFPPWQYRPASMPDLKLHVADGIGPDEPMWCYMETGRAPKEAPPERRQPLEHPSGFREITGVRIVSPSLQETSITHAMTRTGVISSKIGPEHLLELEFDGGGQEKRLDFRSDLPLVFSW